jgi:hypothetical protein
MAYHAARASIISRLILDIVREMLGFHHRGSGNVGMSINDCLIASAIYCDPPATRRQIEERTGLAATTVNTAVHTMLKGGSIISDGKAHGEAFSPNVELINACGMYKSGERIAALVIEAADKLRRLQ